MNALSHPAHRSHAVQRGLTLIELMVALVIGLGVTLAISSLLVAGENHKRTTTSTNDAEQTGAYVFHFLDGVIRGAGSSFAQSSYPSDRGVLGCLLNAAQILPRNAAFPAPFATQFLTGATNTLRVAPILIGQNQSDAGSDILVVMGGSGAAGGVSRQVTNNGNATTLSLDNTVGFVPGDLSLVSQSGVVDCLMEEVNTVASPVLNVGGTTYYTANGTTTNLQTLATNTLSFVTPLGNAVANNVQFQLYGVGANRTLYSYDLLQNLNKVQLVGGDVSQAIADGVVALHAIYGVDINGDGQQDTWDAPTAGGGYDLNTVMNAPAKMLSIVSVRVAIIVRGEYPDKNKISPTQLTWFSGLTTAPGVPLPGLAQTLALSADDQYYRYRVFEFTVPLRNMILLAGGP